MSKYVKNLLSQDIAKRLEGVEDAVLVNVVGLDVNKTVALRKQLREQNIHVLAIKNSLARRATQGTPLHAALEGAEGSLAVVWGAEDFVSLAKVITKLDQDASYEAFTTQGGVMDGEKLTPDRVKQISKWPSRTEQLSILSGQIVSVGANLSGALLGPGGTIAGQIEQKAQEDEQAETE
jgi:ribosomal protein L10